LIQAHARVPIRLRDAIESRARFASHKRHRAIKVGALSVEAAYSERTRVNSATRYA
jgi:hypothetical protein